MQPKLKTIIEELIENTLLETISEVKEQNSEIVEIVKQKNEEFFNELEEQLIKNLISEFHRYFYLTDEQTYTNVHSKPLSNYR